ncbi:hypothetical protein P8452_26218 [Trifolium repens]|nr:hypothetical protein P8452_26218 [Trifolium repens]
MDLKPGIFQVTSLDKCMPWFLAKQIVGHLSRRLQQLDIKCEDQDKESDEHVKWAMNEINADFLILFPVFDQLQH